MLCGGLIVLSFLIKFWRSKLSNSVTKSLTGGWSSAAFWFGIVGLVLVVSRVEMIQFVSMRAIWAIWTFVLGLYVFFQFVQFRRRHYTVVERAHVTDERDKYLPRKKK